MINLFKRDDLKKDLGSDDKNCEESILEYFSCIEAQNKSLDELNKYLCLDSMYKTEQYCHYQRLNTAKLNFKRKLNLSSISTIERDFLNWRGNNLGNMTKEDTEILGKMQLKQKY